MPYTFNPFTDQLDYYIGNLTAAEILTLIKTVDGTTSGLDADLLDGNEAAAFEAAGTMSTHESTYNHENYDTAYNWGDHASGGYALQSVLGTSIGASLLLTTTVLSVSIILQKYHAIDPTADVQSLLGAADYAAMMALLSGTATSAFNFNTQDVTGVDALTVNYVHVGDGGTVNYAIGAGDIYVKDVLEVDGRAYFADRVYFKAGTIDFEGTGSVRVKDSRQFIFQDNVECTFGSASDIEFTWRRTGNDHLYIGIGVGTAEQSGNILIGKKGNHTVDHGHAAHADPHLFIHSADATNVADYIGFWHDQTDAHIEGGAGDLKIDSATSVDITSHDLAAVGLKLAGTLVTASAAELNYSDGVTSAIQAQLDALESEALTWGTL